MVVVGMIQQHRGRILFVFKVVRLMMCDSITQIRERCEDISKHLFA